MKKSVLIFYDNDNKIITKRIVKGYDNLKEFKRYTLRHELRRLNPSQRERIKEIQLLKYKNINELEKMEVFTYENY